MDKVSGSMFPCVWYDFELLFSFIFIFSLLMENSFESYHHVLLWSSAYFLYWYYWFTFVNMDGYFQSKYIVYCILHYYECIHKTKRVFLFYVFFCSSFWTKCMTFNDVTEIDIYENKGMVNYWIKSLCWSDRIALIYHNTWNGRKKTNQFSDWNSKKKKITLSYNEFM